MLRLFNLQFGKIRRFFTIRHVVVLSMACTCLLAGFFMSPPGVRLLNQWKFLPRPERFTELYFTDNQHLPTTFRPGQIQTISFTVRNLERQTIIYKYGIMADAALDQKLALLAHGNFVLHDGQTRTVKVPIQIDSIADRLAVSVVLTDQDQSIHYWVTKSE
jgi:hypothetical protein